MKIERIAQPTEEEGLRYNTGNFSGNGKLEVIYKTPINCLRDIAIAYTPGVGYPLRKIMANQEAVHDYTLKDNLIAVITDGTAVLGWGDIGPYAAYPVMEGKAMMFKMLAGVDAFPICLAEKDTEKLIAMIAAIEPVFGGYNLEDIRAPKCFEIQERLEAMLDIPVFHDDQQGTAVVCLAGITNALKLLRKDIRTVRIVVNGAGASGVASVRLLQSAGAANIVMCDTAGVIYPGRPANMNPWKEAVARGTRPEGLEGKKLADAMKGAEVFIGLSKAGQVSGEMIASMQEGSVVFAMANPIPEIMPEVAKENGARVIATGRYDYPNQVNNVVAFPGIMRGALDVRARNIEQEMLVAAAHAIASLVPDEDLHEDYIVPTPFHPDLYPHVAAAVGTAAVKTGNARLPRTFEEIDARVRAMTRVIGKRFQAFEKILAEEKTA